MASFRIFCFAWPGGGFAAAQYLICTVCPDADYPRLNLKAVVAWEIKFRFACDHFVPEAKIWGLHPRRVSHTIMQSTFFWRKNCLKLELKFVCLASAATVLLAPSSFAALILRTGTSLDVAGITAARDGFRTDLGGGTVVGANGLFNDGTSQRREINWDGVPDAFSSPNGLPANFFNANSPRGAVFSTPGSGFQVSANAGVAPINFGNIDVSYTTTFSPFSAQRLFTPIGSNIMDVTFFVPGTTTPGVTKGFGAIFSDVDVAGVTGLQFFDINGISLGSFLAGAQGGATGFSFLGAFYNDGTTPIARVRITLGNTALGAGVTDSPASRDLVVMDDFLYGNPTGAVPEPGTWGTVSIGIAAAALLRKKLMK